MLTIKIIAVGKLKEQYLKDAIEEYLKRIRPYARVNVVEVAEVLPKGSSAADITQSKNGEGQKILEKAKGFIVALDMNGKFFSSDEFSEFIIKKTVDGVSEISFVIGGSNGLSEEVLKAADLKLSFSKMTFPHQLMRVIFAEQLYRAFMISAGTGYHK